MKKVGKKFIMVLLVSLFLLGIGQVAGAKKWEPYQFRGDEHFEYRILLEEDGEEYEIIYILDIKKSEKDEDIFEVTYTTRGILTRDELGPETAFGLWGVYGISLNMLVINPAYAFFFSQMDLAEGEKMNFFGAGTVKITGKENIAGREGFVCQLFSAEEENKMVAEWVIDPELALPLRSKIFEDDALQGQIELIKYLQY
ncbi:MAG: hypothetical protein Kow00103_00160 [Candidatus Caldatribacteriota bacterium]